ncbi:MAG: tetratricopeptide repeat protein [Candidatus Thermoplasmatota archaeon]
MIATADVSAEEAKDLASHAAMNERWSDAVAWCQRALEQAPTSSRLKLDFAYYLEQNGSVTLAKEVMDEIGPSTPDDADIQYQGAQMALAHAWPDEETIAWILRALHSRPSDWEDIAETDGFDRVRKRPEIRIALGRAQARARRDDEDE